MTTVSISFVDGSRQDFDEDDSFVQRLRSLQKQGLEGRELIDKLISDDWGPPPRFVTIHGPDVDLTIPYK